MNSSSDANIYRHYAKAATGPAAPLVFAFHGTGGDERQLADLASQILPEAGIIAPHGDVSEDGGARFFRRTGEGVYDMEDLRERTWKMIRFVRAHRAADAGRKVYGIGYSNGANILASVIFAAPELFDRPTAPLLLTSFPHRRGRHEASLPDLEPSPEGVESRRLSEAVQVLA